MSVFYSTYIRIYVLFLYCSSRTMVFLCRLHRRTYVQIFTVKISFWYYREHSR